MKYLPRIEVVLALAALVAALVAGLYLVITTFIQHENCYGIQYPNIKCQPLTQANLGPTSARLAVSLSTVIVVYAGGALVAWAQGRAVKPDSRLTAYMSLLTCAVIALSVTVAALGGPGFFFLPATALILLAVAAGLPPLIESYRVAARTHKRSA